MPAERIPIDVKGLKERIENAFPHSAWKELSFAKKARLVLIEGLGVIEKKNSFPHELPQTIAQLVQNNYQKLSASSRFKDLDAIANGAKPTPVDVLLIAAELQVDSVALHDMYLKSFPECANGTSKNGTARTH